MTRHRADCIECTLCVLSQVTISWFGYSTLMCILFLGWMGKSRHKSDPSHTRSRHHAQFQSVCISRRRFDVESTHKKRTRRRPRSIHVSDQHRPDDQSGKVGLKRPCLPLLERQYCVITCTQDFKPTLCFVKLYFGHCNNIINSHLHNLNPFLR